MLYVVEDCNIYFTVRTTEEQGGGIHTVLPDQKYIHALSSFPVKKIRQACARVVYRQQVADTREQVTAYNMRDTAND